MGRTISPFRWKIGQEKERWGQFRENLDNEEKRILDELLLTARRYVSCSMMSCRFDPIEAIFMSIMFDHCKAATVPYLDSQLLSFNTDTNYESDYEKEYDQNATDSDYESSTLQDDDLLESEIKSWEIFADTLSENDKRLFHDMLKKARRYAAVAQVKRDGFPQDTLFMSILLLHHKILCDSGIYCTQNSSKTEFVSL